MHDPPEKIPRPYIAVIAGLTHPGFEVSDPNFRIPARVLILCRTIERSVFEELGTSESEQSHILQDFPEGVYIVVAALAFVAVQHAADGVMHGEPPPSASSTESGC